MRSKEFEKWFAKKASLTEEHISDMWNGEIYESFGYTVEIAWEAWNASREAVIREAIAALRK